MRGPGVLAAKWGQLASRERLLLSATLLVLVCTIADITVYEPLAASMAAARAESVKSQESLAAAIKLKKDMVAELGAIEAPTVAMPSLSSRVADVERKGGLWNASRASGWAAQAHRVFGEDLTELSVASSGSLEAGYHGVYGHAAVLDGVLDWGRMSNYLAQAKRESAFHLEKVEVIQQADGRVRLRLRQRILSAEKSWVDTGGSLPVDGGRR